MTSNSPAAFDQTVDVLVIGSGGGGMTAALTADASGVDTLVVEKSPQLADPPRCRAEVSGFRAHRPNGKRATFPTPMAFSNTCARSPVDLSSDARLRQYVDTAPEMMEFLEKSSGWFEFVWKPGYADYYPELPGGSELGSTINVPAIDLHKLGDEEQNLLQPLALAPKGIWFAPKDLRLFYQVRQNWRGKAVLVKLIWRMFRARVFGDRMAAIGQSLAARMRLAMKEHDIPLWLNSPMTELITDVDGTVTGAVVERDGRQQRIGARYGVILAAGGFDHDMEWRRQHLPVLEKDWSFGNPAAIGDGIRAGEKVGGSTDLLDEAWWFPAICWPDGRLQFMLNERMMPSQFVVNGQGKRFINEAAPYMDFAHAMIEGQKSGVTHIPCWLITDIRSFHRYVVAGHLPIPKVPFAPVPTGWKVPQAWLESGVVRRPTAGTNCARAIDVPADNLRADRRRASTNWRAAGTTTTSTAATAHTTTTTATRRCPTPTCTPLEAAVLRVPDHPRRPRHLGRPADRRTRPRTAHDDSVVKGLYAVGQQLGCRDGPQLRRRRSHHRPRHDLRLRGGQAHRRPVAGTGTQLAPRPIRHRFTSRGN